MLFLYSFYFHVPFVHRLDYRFSVGWDPWHSNNRRSRHNARQIGEVQRQLSAACDAMSRLLCGIAAIRTVAHDNNWATVHSADCWWARCGANDQPTANQLDDHTATDDNGAHDDTTIDTATDDHAATRMGCDWVDNACASSGTICAATTSSSTTTTSRWNSRASAGGIRASHCTAANHHQKAICRADRSVANSQHLESSIFRLVSAEQGQTHWKRFG